MENEDYVPRKNKLVAYTDEDEALILYANRLVRIRRLQQERRALRYRALEISEQIEIMELKNEKYALDRQKLSREKAR